MTPAEKKGFVVGEYYIRETRVSGKMSPVLVTFLKDDGTANPWFWLVREEDDWACYLFNIRSLTPEEKATLLLGIDPCTGEPL